MRITIRLFAIQREQTGWRERPLELPDRSSIANAWSLLVAEYPSLSPGNGVVRFARNAVYADEGDELHEGDQLAVIPPVAGGAPFRRIEITAEPIGDSTLGELRRAVATAVEGAVVLFVGQTRESPGTAAPGQEAEAARFAGERVEELTYEAFEEMALATLETIAEEMADRFGVERLAILHRIGRVPVSETSVAICVAAPHRGAAFDACRYAIEELKARAPIWKSEIFTSGSVWLGAPPRSGPQAAT